jgi:hypothetical protein
MRVLFIAPSETSSGEATVALDIAEHVLAQGGEVHFLGSTYTSGFAHTSLPSGCTTTFGVDRASNQALWAKTLDGFQPDAIVFADYPLLFFQSGSAPLAEPTWCEQLAASPAAIMTIDCLGYAQRAQQIFFGPSHLSGQVENIQPLPPNMHGLLPCPLHDPEPRPGRVGVPFRSIMSPPVPTPEARAAIRNRYASDEELLIVHVTSGWASLWAEAFGLPHYQVLTRILEHYLADLPRPVTIVSVNNGHLLQAATRPGIRIQNLTSLDKSTFEQLLLAADLVLGENRISVSLARAASALRPCGILLNRLTLLELLPGLDETLRSIVDDMERTRRGAVFPYEVFPIWGARDLAQLGILDGNGLCDSIAELPLFGGEATRRSLAALLFDQETQADLKDHQMLYAERVRRLPAADEVVREILASDGALISAGRAG